MSLIFDFWRRLEVEGNSGPEISKGFLRCHEGRKRVRERREAEEEEEDGWGRWREKGSSWMELNSSK